LPLVKWKPYQPLIVGGSPSIATTHLTKFALPHTEMHKHELIPRLERTAIFEQFKRDEFALLIEYLSVRRVDEGAVIFREGDRGGHLCLLLEGRLAVLKDGGNGEKKKVTDVTAGKLIGEVSMMDGMPHSATVVASTSSVLVLLSRENLARICEERPRVGNKLLWRIGQLLSLRLRQTTGKLVDHL
jgi:CRP/FNR family cyclic AMP-dependent transcriptional regulator